MVIQRHIARILFALTILLMAIYYLWIERLVPEIYNNNAPDWFTGIVDELYPRFQVEKQRFSLSFFQHKADQVILRLGLSGLFISSLLAFTPLLKLTDSLSRAYSKYHIVVLRYIFYAGLLFYTWDWYFDIDQIDKMRPFYKGIHIFQIIDFALPSPTLLSLIYFVYVMSLLLSITGIKKVVFATLTCILYVLMQGILLSYEKIEHGQATLLYSCMLMPFLLYETQKNEKRNRQQKSFLLFLIQLSIAGSYLMAGLEKILTSGLGWLDTDTFRGYVLLHNSPIGLSIIENDILSQALPLLALLFQIGFILILFLPKLKLIILLMGIMFHWGTYLIFGIGSFTTPWIFVYIFFLNWDAILLKLGLAANSNNIRKKGI